MLSKRPTEPPQLAVEQARDILAACRDLHEVTEIRDKALAMEAYHRSRRASAEAMSDASAIKALAERRAGEMLAAADKHTGGRPSRKTPSNREGVSTPKLAELGVTEKESHAWQKVAAVPQQDFDREIAKAREERKPVATSALVKLAADKPSRRWKNPPSRKASPHFKPAPVAEPGARFSAIVMDPDWATLGTDGVQRLPVESLAEEDCALWLWCEDTQMRAALECLTGWGFRERAIVALNRVEKSRRGLFRAVMAYCLVATRGASHLRSVRAYDYLEITNRVDAKPVTFYRLVESVCPGSRVAMFGCPRLPGWQSWQPTE